MREFVKHLFYMSKFAYNTILTRENNKYIFSKFRDKIEKTGLEETEIFNKKVLNRNC